MNRESETVEPEPSLTFGLRKEVYFACGSVALLILGYGLYQIATCEEPYILYQLGIMALLLIAGYFRVQISLHSDHIKVRKILGSWQVNFSDIDSIRIGGSGDLGMAIPRDVLLFHTMDGTREINLRLFSCPDLARLFDGLERQGLRIKTIRSRMCRSTVMQIRLEQRKQRKNRMAWD